MASHDKQVLYLSTLTFYPSRKDNEPKKQKTSGALGTRGKTDSSREDDKNPLLPKENLPKRWHDIRFLLFIIINFLVGISYAALFPIYPIEAERKGMSASVYGFVFGVYPLVIFILSPISGKYISGIGAKFMINAGIFVMSICLILFGLLTLSPAGTSFIALSFAIRIVEAIGNTAFTTALYSISAQEFDDIPGTFAYIQSAYVAGLIVGPTFGGYFYEIGSFKVPFAIIGGLLFLSAIVTTVILPEIAIDKSNQKGFLRLLTKPSILISCFSFLIINFTLGFLVTTLEPRIRKFHVRPVLLGLLFIISGIVCIVANRLWAFFAKYKNLKVLSAEGALIILVTFCFFGPAPFFPFDPSLWLISLSLAVLGIGIGGELLIPFLDAIQHAIRIGYPDNLETYGMVSGLWFSSSALGQFIGPSLAGLLLDSIGYSYATLLIICLHCIVAGLNFGYYFYEKRRNTSDE